MRFSGKFAIAIAPALLMVAACSGGDDTENVDPNATGEAAADAAASVGGSPMADKPVQSTGVPITVGEGVLSSPNDFQMAVAFYEVIGLEPPLDQWAKEDPRARSANEFDRQSVASRVQQELLLSARSVAGVGYVELNTSSRFGEYDMAAQGFRLDALDSSRFYTWNYGGGQYKLTMENGNGASLWKIGQDDARSIVESMSYRQVDLKLRIKIVGAMPEGQGGTLKGKIVAYEVFDSNERKLGGMVFK